MAFDAFLKVGNIDGESTDFKHKDWIEVLSFHHGVSQPGGALQSGSGRGSERAAFEDLVIAKPLDKATPKLVFACAAGQRVPSVELELVHPQTRTCFMKYTLADCIVTSVYTSGTAASEARPTDEVSFSFAKIVWTYARLGPDGQMEEQIETSWDRTAKR